MYNGQIRDYRSATVQLAVGTGHTYPSAGTQNKYKQLETAKFWCKKTHPKRPPSKKSTLNKSNQLENLTRIKQEQMARERSGCVLGPQDVAGP